MPVASEHHRRLDVETRRWTAVEQTHYAGYPTWSSNSQFIYCLHFDNDSGVFRIRISDGAEKRIVDLKGSVTQARSPLGWVLSLRKIKTSFIRKEQTKEWREAFSRPTNARNSLSGLEMESFEAL